MIIVSKKTQRDLEVYIPTARALEGATDGNRAGSERPRTVRVLGLHKSMDISLFVEMHVEPQS